MMRRDPKLRLQDDDLAPHTGLRMGAIIGLAALACLVLAYLVGILPLRPETWRVTGDRAQQTSGESLAGRSQDMPAREAADPAGANESGRRAQTLQQTASPDVALDAAQRDRIRSYLAQNRPAAADASKLSISIGASVPRQIETQPLPPELVQIMQKFHGDEFLTVPGQLIIVEPKARRIVAIIPLSA
jgi:hypothetical protein